MTVQEVIDLLNTIEDKSRELMTEGCDCWGDVVALGFVDDHGESIPILGRSDGDWDKAKGES